VIAKFATLQMHGGLLQEALGGRISGGYCFEGGAWSSMIELQTALRMHQWCFLQVVPLCRSIFQGTLVVATQHLDVAGET
jgi:hypothetical protein